MNIDKKTLINLLGMIRDVGERLELSGLNEEEIEKLIEMDYQISDSFDHDSSSRHKNENEILLKVAKMILDSDK